MKKILFVLLLAGALFSCEKSDKVTLMESTGRINNVLIVMNDEDWEGRVGDTLRAVIAEPVVGLPQEEYQFTVNQVDPLTFNNLFKKNRNILFVGVDTMRHFYTNENLYASPQKTLTVLGEDKDDLIDNIWENRNEIISVFKEADMALYQSRVTKSFHKTKDIRTMQELGLSFKIPTTYRKVDDAGDFLWYRYTMTRGLLNLIAYEVPLNGRDSLAPLELVAYRDSIGKVHIPGQFDNTFMKTETKVAPVIKEVEVGGRAALETRGLWYVENDYMGGPFISYTFKDAENDRLIVIEGFSYTPSAKKRDFVFELESILKTVQFL